MTEPEIFEGEGAIQSLEDVHGILVPGGFGERGAEGKIAAARFARERRVVVRRAADPVRIEIDSPVNYYRLDGDVSNRQMNALLLEIPPGCELPKVHRESGEDFLYVLSGEISLTVGDETMSIGQGDSLHINSQLDHSCVNNTDQAARMIWVGTPSIFET